MDVVESIGPARRGTAAIARREGGGHDGGSEGASRRSARRSGSRLAQLFEQCTAAGIERGAVDGCLDSPDPIGALSACLARYGKHGDSIGAANAAVAAAADLQMPGGCCRLPICCHLLPPSPPPTLVRVPIGKARGCQQIVRIADDRRVRRAAWRLPGGTGDAGGRTVGDACGCVGGVGGGWRRRRGGRGLGV